MRNRHSPRPHSLPSRWLFTDELLGGSHPADPLWRAIAALPRGAGIVFRHHQLSPKARHALAIAVAALARRRHLILILAEGPRGVCADGRHLSRRTRRRVAKRGLVTASSHNRSEMVAAFRAGADLVFLSPAFATGSHPGARPLGPVRFGLLARGAAGPVVALGGMSELRHRRLHPLGAHGFAAIDFWTQRAKK